MREDGRLWYSNLGGLSFYEDETGKYVVGADSVPKKLGNCNTYSYFNGDIINYSISVLDKNPNGSVAASIIADTNGYIKYNSTMNDWWYKYSTVEFFTKNFLDSKGFTKMKAHVNLNSEVSSLNLQLLNSENLVIASGTSNIKNTVSLIELDNVPEKFRMKIILNSPNSGPNQSQGNRNATGFIYNIELFSWVMMFYLQFEEEAKKYVPIMAILQWQV